jgi:hypothetical protein
VVNGQSSADTLFVEDQDLDGRTAFLGASRIWGLDMPGAPAAGGIAYSGIESLTLALGARRHRERARHRERDEHDDPHRRRPADLIRWAAPRRCSGDLDAIAGLLMVTGQSGNVTLWLDDFDAGPDTGFVTANRIWGSTCPAGPGRRRHRLQRRAAAWLRLGTRADT